MKIEHVAIWAIDIEKIKNFYVTYFNAQSNDKYTNKKNSFDSYFLTFESGSRLEIMQMPTIPLNKNDPYLQNIGLIHLAISVGSKQKVRDLTEQLRGDGYEVVSEPRATGDGYFESCILDPENNRIEIME